MTREQFAVAAYKAFTAVMEADHADELVPIHAELCAAADEYAAGLIEIYARPPLPERLKVRTVNLDSKAAGL